MNYPEANRSDIWIRIFDFPPKLDQMVLDYGNFSHLINLFHVSFLTTEVYSHVIGYK